MATKIEITEDIRRQYGNAISQNQAKAYLGMGNTQAAAFLADAVHAQRQEEAVSGH